MQTNSRYQRACLLLALGIVFGSTLGSASSKAQGIDTVEGAKQIVENLVMEGLPGPAGELVTVFQNSPEIVKNGLRGWLRKKMLNAVYDGDIDTFDKYLNFYSCISNKDCEGIKKLQKQAMAVNRPSPPVKVGRTSGAGKFKILEVFYPRSVKSGGRKGNLRVYWRGNPQLPITMIYRPKRGNCPKGVNCSTEKATFSSNTDPLVFKGAVWCVGVSRNIFFDYEVVLQDAAGNETAPYPAAINCIRTGK